MNSLMFSIDLIEKFAREGTLKVTTLYKKKKWDGNLRTIFMRKK